MKAEMLHSSWQEIILSDTEGAPCVPDPKLLCGT